MTHLDASIQATFGSPNWMPPPRGKHGMSIESNEDALQTLPMGGSTQCKDHNCMSASQDADSLCGWTPPPGLQTVKDQVMDWSGTPRWTPPHQFNQPIQESSTRCGIIGHDMLVIGEADYPWMDPPSMIDSYFAGSYIWCSGHASGPSVDTASITSGTYVPEEGATMFNILPTLQTAMVKRSSIDARMSGISLVEELSSDEDSSMQEEFHFPPIFVVYDCNHYNCLLLAGRVGLSYPHFWKLIQWDCKHTDHSRSPAHLMPVQQFWVMVLALVANAEQVVLEIQQSFRLWSLAAECSQSSMW
ncbi:hypothetical protein J3A83DRAFT_4196270 [Scleroderma citrinum]